MHKGSIVLFCHMYENVQSCHKSCFCRCQNISCSCSRLDLLSLKKKTILTCLASDRTYWQTATYWTNNKELNIFDAYWTKCYNTTNIGLLKPWETTRWRQHITKWPKRSIQLCSIMKIIFHGVIAYKLGNHAFLYVSVSNLFKARG